MEQRIEIPREEFSQRVQKTQELMKQQDIDVLLAFGNEAEPQFVRYLSSYWPSFETAGVLLGQEGKPLLLIGPESLTFAADRSVIPDIRRVQCFRESSNPDYPGEVLDRFSDAVAEVCGGRVVRTAALAGINLAPKLVYDAYEEALRQNGGGEITRGDDLLMQLRMIKSPSEIACMRKAGEITHQTFDFVLEQIRPGMTEQQVRGLANQKLFELGAECEAYPIWVLAGKGSNQAISRARPKVLQPDDFVHLQIGARYEGYAATIGRQVILGKPEPWMTDVIKAGYEAHDVISSQLYMGNEAVAVSDAYTAVMRRSGYESWLLYGPCHATGLMEGEPPWIEAHSNYRLRENMTYCIDIFLGNDDGYGLRIEDSVRVGTTGADSLTDYPKEIFIRG